jgi:hypothetical protein
MCATVVSARASAAYDDDEAAHKQNSEALHDWYKTTPGLNLRCMGIAWKYRAENPVIVVTTPASDVDSGLHPKLTAMARAEFEACEALSADVRNVVKNICSQSNFSPENNYVVMLQPSHPGSESWASGFVGMRNMADKECLEIMAALALAVTNEDISLAITRAQAIRTARLHNEVYVRGNLAALTSGEDDSIIRCVRAMGFDCRVRLSGLVSAAHLNGREGSIMSLQHDNTKHEHVENIFVCIDTAGGGSSCDPANTQRCIVDISEDLDGSSMLSVRGGNCVQLNNT